MPAVRDRNTDAGFSEVTVTLKRFIRPCMLVLAGASLAMFSACSSTTSGGSASPTSAANQPFAASSITTMTNDQGWPRVEGLRGKRYCEVLLARLSEGRLNADVWNTYGLNDCPDAAFKALDPAAIAKERGALTALLNGPRYWLMDAIEKKPVSRPQKTTFGTLDMFLAATVDLGPIPPNLAPYIERRVARDSVFEYSAGTEVYELTDPGGKVYVMQSYSEQGDAHLSAADLPGLASRITPPAGWTYKPRTLGSTLRALTPGGEATVIQDDLADTYQLIVPG
jgi:hypothetical protein